MAREFVAISLASKPYFELGKTYAVYFGAFCNLQTVIRRRIPSDVTPDCNLSDDNEYHQQQIQSDKAVNTTVPTPKICTLGTQSLSFDRHGNECLTGMSPPTPSHPDTSTTGKDANMWIEYQTQCHKAKQRTGKFGTEYRQPPSDAFFKQSEARRLKANPERGFDTGIDILSVDEREKARKRKERFEDKDTNG